MEVITWPIGVRFVYIIYHFEYCDDMNQTQKSPKFCFFLGYFSILSHFFFKIFIFLDIEFECYLFCFH